MLDLTPYAQQNARVTLTLRNEDELTTTLRFSDEDDTHPVTCDLDFAWTQDCCFNISGDSGFDIIAIRPANATPAATAPPKAVGIAASGATLFVLFDDGTISRQAGGTPWQCVQLPGLDP